jgi:hypothetical protein
MMVLFVSHIPVVCASSHHRLNPTSHPNQQPSVIQIELPATEGLRFMSPDLRSAEFPVRVDINTTLTPPPGPTPFYLPRGMYVNRINPQDPDCLGHLVTEQPKLIRLPLGELITAPLIKSAVGSRTQLEALGSLRKEEIDSFFDDSSRRGENVADIPVGYTGKLNYWGQGDNPNSVLTLGKILEAQGMQRKDVIALIEIYGRWHLKKPIHSYYGALHGIRTAVLAGQAVISMNDQAYTSLQRLSLICAALLHRTSAINQFPIEENVVKHISTDPNFERWIEQLSADGIVPQEMKAEILRFVHVSYAKPGGNSQLDAMMRMVAHTGMLSTDSLFADAALFARAQDARRYSEAHVTPQDAYVLTAYEISSGRDMALIHDLIERHGGGPRADPFIRVNNNIDHLMQIIAGFINSRDPNPVVTLNRNVPL